MTARKIALIVLVAAAICAVPSVGSAAEPSTPAPEAPLASTPTDVQLWMAAKPSEAVVIVSVAVPDATPLPATVRIPVVDGMTVDWAGEVSGADASQDLRREYVTKKGPKGGTFVEFVVAEFRSAQVDLSGKKLTQEGDEVSTSLEFTQSTDSSETNFSVRLPAVASEITIKPQPIGRPTTNESGETLHVLPTLELGAGEKSTISVAYSTALPGVPGAEGDSVINTLIGSLAALAFAVIIVLFIVLRRRQPRGNTVGEDSTEL